MLYAVIVLLFVLLVVVAVKWAKAARAVRVLSIELEIVRDESISIDSALYAVDRRFGAGLEQGYIDGYTAALAAAEKAATEAVIKGKPPVVAIRTVLRNTTK